MSQTAQDTEANVPLNSSPTVRALQTGGAEKVKEYFKLVLVVLAIVIVIVNLITSVRAGQAVSVSTLEELSKVVSAAIEERVPQWRNATWTAQ